MATITLTVPNPVVNRVTDAICTRFGYQVTIDGVPNPQSKSDFLKQQIAIWIKAQVREHEANTAAATASTNAGADVDANIVIT